MRLLGRLGKEPRLWMKAENMAEPFPTKSKSLPLAMKFRNGTRGGVGRDGVTAAEDILVGTQIPERAWRDGQGSC